MVFAESTRYGEKMKLQIHTKADEQVKDSGRIEDAGFHNGTYEYCVKDLQHKWINGTLKIDPKCKKTGDDEQDRWNNPRDGNKQINKTFQDKYFGPYLDLEFTISTGGTYQVIENTRAFSVENCWSGIGGFVGIFVGLSLMAMPDLLQDFYQFLKIKVFNK